MNTFTGHGAAMPPIPSDQDASGRLLGDEEIALVTEAIRSGTLTSTKGTFVKSFVADFAALIGVTHASACASGTAAIHAAIAAIDPAPGDEIVTSPITDMGAITPIIYQTAIPVFADVDPRTGNVTAETIERVLSPKTRAIIVTHLFGNPAEMGPILELAARHGIPVIEDCAQAYGATYDGRPVGTLGAIGCFSLQQGKHITTGEGGMVVTDDAELGRRMRLFIDKAWGYGDEKPDHYFAALNARMTELQGAVALAQLRKLPHKRRAASEHGGATDRRHLACPRGRGHPDARTRRARLLEVRPAGVRRSWAGPTPSPRRCGWAASRRRRVTSRSPPSNAPSSATSRPSAAAAFPSRSRAPRRWTMRPRTIRASTTSSSESLSCLGTNGSRKSTSTTSHSRSQSFRRLP